MFKKNNKKGSTIVELIVVTMIFAILVPASMSIFLSGTKINGQGYVQHSAAMTLTETADMIRFIRSQGYESLQATGISFYMVRTGTGSWLKKGELTKDLFDRKVTITYARRHDGGINADNIYMDGDTGDSYEDQNTKKIEINILWSPDYLPQEILTQIFYITNWQEMNFTYSL